MSCSICYEPITSHKLTLKCGHEYCHKCILKYSKMIYKSNNYYLPCPCCRDLTKLSNLPVPEDVTEKADKYKMLIGDLNPCKHPCCSKEEVIGNEGFCEEHNDQYKKYSEDQYDLTFEWLYRIAKHADTNKKYVFFDVVLKIVNKFSFTNYKQITDYINPKIREFTQYGKKVLYETLDIKYIPDVYSVSSPKVY